MKKGFSSVHFVKGNKADFYKVLRQQVNEYFKRKRFPDMQWEHDIQDHMHAFVISCSIYFNVNTRSQCLVVYSAAAVTGVGMAGVGLSVMHDANHGAYSKSPLVNNIIGKVLVL